jgi:putative nucleotidyltransferase with HDIG domain
LSNLPTTHYLPVVIIWLAVVLWLVIVAWSLALMRAAGARDGRPQQRAEPRVLREPRSGLATPARRQALFTVEALVLVGSLGAAALLSKAEQWESLELVGLLAVLAWGGDFLTLETKRARISGSFLGLVLAMALLGPAPAVVIGLGCAVTDALHSRTRGGLVLGNAAIYTLFPLLGALVLSAAEPAAEGAKGGFALAVFVVFCLTNVLNFTLVAGHIVLTRGGSLREMFERVFIPVLPWELATGSITAMAVLGFELYGTGLVALFVLALGVCQLLLRSLLRGHEHGEEVVRRKDQLDVRHEGMVGLLLETLALRDPTAARHAAAVAHYGRELAAAAGLGEHAQAVVHTAGLLHDIGKEALPDHILLGRSELQPAERRLVERHPTDGARLLLRVEGLGEVANAVLAHHERIDGRGYPDGLAGDDIPVAARILAIAEAYDVLTAPDSYRVPLSAAEAEDELRRVAGSQLDGRLVWLFVTQVLRGKVIDHAGHIADLEAELQVQRRVRGVLDQPLVLGPPAV